MNHKIASYREQSTPRGRSAVWFTTIYNEANHMSKFQLYCSCLTCKLHISAQNLSSHFNSKHISKLPVSKCLHCETPIYNPKFCSTSCSAIYTNARKDWSKIKTGPPNTVTTESIALRKKERKNHIRVTADGLQYTIIHQCEICNKFHPGTTKTCSPQCKGKLISLSMKQAIYNGHNPNKNRGRGKRSWMETSFIEWLDENQVTCYFTEEPFKRLDMIKTYFADFYFPDIKLIIELDGTQHNKTVAYDTERDSYINRTYNVTIIRVSYKEYQQKSRIIEIKNLLNIQ